MSASETASSISGASSASSTGSSIPESCEGDLESTRVPALRQSIRDMEAQLVDLAFRSLSPELLMDWVRVPLTCAAATGNSAAVKRLLAAGVKTETPPERMRPVPLLHEAASNGDEAVVEELLKAGVDVHEKDSSHDNRTALHCAAAAGRDAAVRALAGAGARIDVRDSRRRTPLHHACLNGHRGVVVFLLLKGSRAQHESMEVDPPLHLAAINNHPGVIEDLISFGNAFVGCRDLQGRSALHVAAQHRQVEACVALLRGGAAEEGPIHWNGKSCLDVAALRGHTGRLLQILTTAEAKCVRRRLCSKALYYAISANKPDTISDLVALGADVEYHTPGEKPNLHAAVLRRANRAAEALLRAGANVQTRFTGGTPLHLACSHSLPSMVKLLLHWGADECATNSDGDTPLAVVGSYAKVDDDPAFEEFMDNRGGKRIRNMLEKAPADRIWHRRGWLVLCRARWLEKIGQWGKRSSVSLGMIPDGATDSKKRRGKVPGSVLVVEPRGSSLNKGKTRGRNKRANRHVPKVSAGTIPAVVLRIGTSGILTHGGAGKAARVARRNRRTRFVGVVERLLMLREDSIFREVVAFL